MKEVIIILFGICVFFTFLIIIGEKYSTKHPESKFTKWWRNNMISENPYE